MKNEINRKGEREIEHVSTNLKLVDELLGVKTSNYKEYTRLLDYFKNHPDGALTIFLENYDLKYEHLILIKEKFRTDNYETRGIWQAVVSNKSFFWTESLLDEFKDVLHWRGIARSQNVDWSFKIIKRFEGELLLHLADLLGNRSVPFSIELIKYIHLWYGKRYYRHPDRFWIIISEKLAHLEDAELFLYFSKEIDWDIFSRSIKGKYSTVFFEKLSDRLNWNIITQNKNLEWTDELIAKFSDVLGKIKKEPGDKPIQRKENDLIENIIIDDENFDWTPEIVDKVMIAFDELYVGHKMQFGSHEFFHQEFASNPALPWSKELIEKYSGLLTDWEWDRSRFNDQGGELFLDSLAANPGLPWSIEFIRHFEDKWNWKALSDNTGIPWSIELLDCFKDRWNWDRLKLNPALPWSNDLLLRYQVKWLTNQFEYGDPSRYYWPSIYDNESINWNIDVIIDSKLYADEEGRFSILLDDEEYISKYGETRAEYAAKYDGFNKYDLNTYKSIIEKINGQQAEELFDKLMEFRIQLDQKYGG